MTTTRWPLKTWDGDKSGWCQPLSEFTTVCMTDEDVPLVEQRRLNYVKPRFFYLAKSAETPPVHTTLPGRHLLLTEGEARRLLDYLADAFDDIDIDNALVAEDAGFEAAKKKKTSAAKGETANGRPQKKQAKRGGAKRR